jgi:hypothetical protein
LVGRVLGALCPRVLCRFVQERVNGARYLAIAPAHFVARFCWLIVAKTILSVERGAFIVKTLCQAMLIVVITIAIDVAALIIAINVQMALAIA